MNSIWSFVGVIAFAGTVTMLYYVPCSTCNALNSRKSFRCRSCHCALDN